MTRKLGPLHRLRADQDDQVEMSSCPLPNTHSSETKTELAGFNSRHSVMPLQLLLFVLLPL